MTDTAGHRLHEGSCRKVIDMSCTEANCQLFRGDCLQVMKRLPARCAQAVITDPPYGTTDCIWDRRVDLDAWWEQIQRVTTEGAVIAIFAAQPFVTDLINSRRRFYRYDLIWDKLRPVGFLNANRQPMRVHEHVLIFGRRPGLGIYRAQKLPGKPYRTNPTSDRSTVYHFHGSVGTVNTGWRHPTSILRHAKPHQRSRLHPTEKPVSLLQWLVLSYSRRGSRVLDTFMGSGSTGEATLSHGRHFIGIEQDRQFYRASRKRLWPLMDARSRARCKE
jgi:DNA modification methylase